MSAHPNNCDRERSQLLQQLEGIEPGFELMIKCGRYFSKVDDRSGTNNFESAIKDCTKECQRMSNTRLWIGVNAHSNLQKLVDQLGLNWPQKSEQTFEHIKNVFSEIDQDFSSKGLRSSTVPGINPYKPDPPQQQNNTNKSSKQQSQITTADEDYNPILDKPELKNIDKKIAERILNEVVIKTQQTSWDDIAGLEDVKQAINEIVVYPMQNPELFKGLLAPAKGLLLFGPPGTGKTLIGKCIASESGATFFAISASSLTSKWVGEGEMMVRAMFAVARAMQPSVVFIDEIDSLLTQRVDGEHDSSRRLKTEFLLQFDGVSTTSDDRLLIVGATNRPQELDEAARRRFTKRLYVPLPGSDARRQIINTLMLSIKHELKDECIDHIVRKTEGYSGADMATLCKEAALCTVRDLISKKGNAKNLANDDLRNVSRCDFETALKRVKASVSSRDLDIYDEWDLEFGAGKDAPVD